jgi:hypothetical protein
MTTAIMMGEFLANGNLRKEFYDICFSMKGHWIRRVATLPVMQAMEPQAAAAAFGAEVGVWERAWGDYVVESYFTDWFATLI